MKKIIRSTLFLLAIILFSSGSVNSAQLKAGVAKVNITNLEVDGIINDSLYVKALVLDDGITKAVIITADAIVLDEERISSNYITNIRMQLQKDLNVKPSNVMFNASHLHGAGYNVAPDIEQRTIMAIKKAWKSMVPVNIFVGEGYEDRITENRRLKLKNGKEWTIRHANPLPPDGEVVAIGPVDPEIGILRLDKKNGEALAVVYNFTGHPYQGVPSKGVTADFPGIASKVIEDNLNGGTIALFLQGFAGDITPVLYKDVNSPRDAGYLGNILGISTLNTLKNVQHSSSAELKVIHEIIKLPRRTDLIQKIESLEAEQTELLESLRGTSLNFKAFLPLYVKDNLFPEYPSYYSHRYLHDEMIGRNDMIKLDEENRRNMDKYLRNIHSMEKLARIQENLSHLNRRLEQNEASGEKTIDVEVQAMRIGEFVLVTFPGEATVQVGLNIKEKSPYEYTYVAGYTNGSVGYAPTAEQFNGGAYEDSNCLLAPEWQKQYEEKVMEILSKL